MAWSTNPRCVVWNYLVSSFADFVFGLAMLGRESVCTEWGGQGVVPPMQPMPEGWQQQGVHLACEHACTNIFLMSKIKNQVPLWVLTVTMDRSVSGEKCKESEICSDKPQWITLVASVSDWREKTMSMKILSIQRRQIKKNKKIQQPQVM